jgi:hypothetical protein
MSFDKRTGLAGHNRTLINFVRAHGPVTTIALAEISGVPDDGLQLFIRRLQYLKSAGHLVRVSTGVECLWAIAQAGTQDAVHEAPEAPEVVPPRRVNVMHGPVWQPKPETVARSGAHDHLMCPSRGYRC